MPQNIKDDSYQNFQYKVLLYHICKLYEIQKYDLIGI